MKRFLLCFVLLAAAAGSGVYAESSASPAFPLTIDTFEGAYYNAQTLPAIDTSNGIMAFITSLEAFAGVLNNLRISAIIDFEARIGKLGGFGGEVGAYYNVYKDADGNFVASFLDLPYRLKLSFTAGWFKAEAFGGVLFAMWFDTSTLLYSPYLEAGGRIVLGPVYLEGSYAFPFGPEYQGYPRFGLGTSFPISR